MPRDSCRTADTATSLEGSHLNAYMNTNRPGGRTGCPSLDWGLAVAHWGKLIDVSASYSHRDINLAEIVGNYALY